MTSDSLQAAPNSARIGPFFVSQVIHNLRDYGGYAIPGGGRVRIGVFNPGTGEWGFIHYPLDAAAEGGWVGLSELTSIGNGQFLVIERDNQIGDAAKVKKIFKISAGQMMPAALGTELPVVTKEEVLDFIPDLKAATNGYVVDKVEGFAIDADGEAFIVTDNDGVDDSSGETLFWSVGRVE